MQGREHVLEGVGHVLAAATIGGLAMLAWLAGILAEILTVAVGALILSLVALGWKRLAPEPVVLWLLAGPIGRLLGVDGQAKRLQRSARRREFAERPP
jgi:hypothetical protein